MEQAEWVVAGDSWASLSVEAISTVFQESTYDITIGGSTASWWLERRDPAVDLLETANACGAHSVWLSIGALDNIIDGTSPRRIARMIETLVMPLVHSGITVVHAGYNDPWFPEWPGLMGELAAEEPLYNYIDMIHLDPLVSLVDWGHLRPEDYLRRVNYAQWWLEERRRENV
jgi:hypothetical protein